MITSIKMSTNAWEFIRQCKEERKFPDIARILQEAARLSNDSSKPQYSDLHTKVMFLAGCDLEHIKTQRQMIRELATEMLGKVLYTQKEFAGKLISLMDEFGIGVAVVGNSPSWDNSAEYYVDIYTPEQWGKRYNFDNEEGAKLWASYINGYGTFTL